MGRILVIGVGNTVMGDDGLGVHVLNAFRSRSLPAYVDTLEAGTALLDALPDLQEYDKLILLDAIESDQDGVSVIRDLRPSSMDSLKQGFSLHDIGVEEALSFVRLENGCLPEVTIIGVRPKHIGFTTKLSDYAASKIPELVDTVMNEILSEEAVEMTHGVYV